MTFGVTFLMSGRCRTDRPTSRDLYGLWPRSFSEAGRDQIGLSRSDGQRFLLAGARSEARSLREASKPLLLRRRGSDRNP